MRIEIVVVPTRVEELIVRVGNECRPASWFDIDDYGPVWENLLSAMREDGNESGYTLVHLTSHNSLLRFEGGEAEIEGEEIERSELAAHIQAIYDVTVTDLPLVVVRIGSDEQPASQKDIESLMDELKPPFTIIVGHHALRLFARAL
jgi:hypothetical protein